MSVKDASLRNAVMLTLKGRVDIVPQVLGLNEIQCTNFAYAFIITQ